MVTKRIKNLHVDETVYATNQEFTLISHEKALITIRAGTAWCYLKMDDRRVGIAYNGSSHFVVDAIAETSAGAVGRSVSGDLVGIQLFIGQTRIDSISSTINTSALQQLGYSSEHEFCRAIEYEIRRDFEDEERMKFSDTKGDIFIGKDENEKSVILVLNDDNLVFVHEKRVFVLGDDNMVSVDRGGVFVDTSSSASPLIIDRRGIHGAGLEHIGPMIRASVGEAMRGLSRLKRVKHKRSKTPRRIGRSKYSGQVYDNVDDFDWDD